MFRPAALLAVLGLTLCACSGGPGELPKVIGAPGAPPVVKIPKGEPDPRVRMRVLHQGEGARTRKDQAVVANVEMRKWSDGGQYLSSWGTRQPTTVLFDGTRIGRSWETALVGRRPGARVLMVTPARFGMGGGGRAPGRIDPGDTMVEVFDVIGGYSKDAQVKGVAKTPDPKVFPLVAVPPGAEPAITITPARPPADLAVTTLVEGTGRAVRPGSTFVTNYAAARWEDGTTYDSSYRRGGPNGFVLGPRSVPPGWERALDGVRAGSRVEIVVPKSLGRGFQMTLGGIGAPPDSTIVYVLDVLDVK